MPILRGFVRHTDSVSHFFEKCDTIGSAKSEKTLLYKNDTLERIRKILADKENM